MIAVYITKKLIIRRTCIVYYIKSIIIIVIIIVCTYRVLIASLYTIYTLTVATWCAFNQFQVLVLLDQSPTFLSQPLRVTRYLLEGHLILTVHLTVKIHIAFVKSLYAHAACVYQCMGVCVHWCICEVYVCECVCMSVCVSVCVCV